MKIQVLSDLHLEYRPLEVPDTGADLIVLAGDIEIGERGVRFALDELDGRPVLYVPGNHEYYGHDLLELRARLREMTEGTNVHFLDGEEWILGGVRFLGCTLWTDFLLYGEEKAQNAMELAHHHHGDFRRIRTGDDHRRLSPHDTLAFHRHARSFLERKLEERFDGPTVIVTHHAPTPRSLSDQYRGDLLSAAFLSDLEDLMSGERVQLWIHGHTHHHVDLDVKGTRVVCNPRGYPQEHIPDFRPDFVIEL